MKNNTVCVLPPSFGLFVTLQDRYPSISKNGGGVEIALNFCNYVTCHMIW